MSEKIHANEEYKRQLSNEIIYFKNQRKHLDFVIMLLELEKKNIQE